jgi:hypothetical protein
MTLQVKSAMTRPSLFDLPDHGFPLGLKRFWMGRRRAPQICNK